MYNPDQHYEVHTLHLKELYQQAEQRRMMAALTQYRPARIDAAGRLLGLLLVRLGLWLSRSATSSRPNLGWRVSRKPDRWSRAVVMLTSALGDRQGVGDRTCAAETCNSCVPR
jgi:hypothetical protein